MEDNQFQSLIRNLIHDHQNFIILTKIIYVKFNQLF